MSKAPSVQNLDAAGLKNMIDLLKSEKAISELPLGSTTGPDGRTKLDMTNEELDRIQESFKNPEFRKMFSEYYDEITDPKYRAETEAYLRQLEEGGETPKDMKIVKPSVGWAFEARMKKELGGYKVYINVVHDKCVQKYVEKPTDRGLQVSIPNMTGTPRFEVDLEGGGKVASSNIAMHPVAGGLAPPEEDGRNILTVDVCFHPETVARTLGKDTTSMRWRDMIMKFAAECADTRLSQDNYGGDKTSPQKPSGSTAKELTKIDPNSLKLLKDIRCVGGTPGVLGVRDTHEGNAGPAASTSAAVENAKKSSNSTSSKPKPLATPVAAAPSVPQPPAKSATVVKTSSGVAPQPVSSSPPPPPAPVMRDKNGVEMRAPTSQKLVHQGAINLSDHMSGPSQQAAVVGSTRPESLKLTFVLKGVTRAAMIDCEVEEKRVLLRTDPIGEGEEKFIYYALILLPFPILKDDPRTKSKWTRDTCTLDISMQVQKPEQLKFTTPPSAATPSIQVLSSTTEETPTSSEEASKNTSLNSTTSESNGKVPAASSSSPASVSSSTTTTDASSSSNPNSRWIKSSLPKVEPVVVPPQLPLRTTPSSSSASTTTESLSEKEKGGEPPYHWSQTTEGVRIIIDVPSILAESVKVERLMGRKSDVDSSSSSSALDISISFLSLVSPSQLTERQAQGYDPLTPTSPNVQEGGKSYSYCLELSLMAPVRLPALSGNAPAKVDMGTSRVDASPLNLLIILAKDKTHRLHQAKWPSITRIAEEKVGDETSRRTSLHDSGSAASAVKSKNADVNEEEEEEDDDEEEVEEIYELGSGGTFDLTKAPKRLPKQPQKKKEVPVPMAVKQTSTAAAATGVKAPSTLGLPKCMYCGGWGVGLVSESTGMCAHCTRLRQAIEETKKVNAKKEAAPATTTASPATTSASPAPAPVPSLSPKAEVASAPAPKVSSPPAAAQSSKRKPLSSLLSEID